MPALQIVRGVCAAKAIGVCAAIMRADASCTDPLFEELFGGAAAEKAEHHASRGPVIVLGGGIAASAKSGPVIVDVDQANFPVARGAEVDSASGFIGHAVRGSLDAAAAGVQARATDQGLHKGSKAPAASLVIEETASEVIAVQNVLDTVNRHKVVAGVSANLQPRLQVVAERAHAPIEIRRGSGTGEAGEPVAGIEFEQKALA